MDILQGNFDAVRVTKFAVHGWHHLDWKPRPKTYRKNPSVWPHCLRKKQMIIYFLRVVHTLKHYSDVVSDIPSRSSYCIFILTLYPTFFLAYALAFYLAFYLACILTFFLASYLASILKFYLASFQTFFLAFSMASGWHPAMPTERSGACGWGPAAPSEIRSSRLRSGSVHWASWSSQLRSATLHWDLELSVEVHQWSSSAN